MAAECGLRLTARTLIPLSLDLATGGARIDTKGLVFFSNGTELAIEIGFATVLWGLFL